MRPKVAGPWKCGAGGPSRSQVGKALKGGAYVVPTIVRCASMLPIVREETFAPILYLVPITSLDDAIALRIGSAYERATPWREHRPSLDGDAPARQ